MTAPSIRLVVPYFGPRPSYLPLVVKSMAANPDVHWLLLTDAPVPDAPPNVSVRRWEFTDLAARIQGHFDFPISLERPYKLCDFRPAFGEVFADELRGWDFWGHSDLDVLFGRVRDHLPAEAFEADKVLIQGNFALYRNTAEAAGWFRHEVAGVSYREVMSNPAAMYFDEMAGIHHVLRDLGVRVWDEHTIFDLSFRRYRTRAEHPAGRDPRRYAWEDGEICEYRLQDGVVVRRSALLAHLQKRTMRPPSPAVLAADRYWILANGFAVQERVSKAAVRSARIPVGRELLPFYVRRVRRSVRRRAARRAAGRRSR
ncbi:DUF6625 family protein [Modestobacter marinus]|uniref:DUF6625 family protein n=1 Tax=Modestobacter marinus TaxID=477641 RepID=UPI001C97B04B|nr:DUF6625 family protein [Modestobacter marinus]